MKLIILVMITVVVLASVLIMNATQAVDCTATSTWSGPAVTHCIERS